MVPLASPRHRGTGYREEDRDHHLPHCEDQGRRHEQHSRADLLIISSLTSSLTLSLSPIAAIHRSKTSEPKGTPSPRSFVPSPSFFLFLRGRPKLTIVFFIYWIQRSPTNFGRPNWDRTFQGIADQHPDTDCGVFFVRTIYHSRPFPSYNHPPLLPLLSFLLLLLSPFQTQLTRSFPSPLPLFVGFSRQCGPAVLSKQLHIMSNKYTTPGGTRFFFGKENF